MNEIELKAKIDDLTWNNLLDHFKYDIKFKGLMIDYLYVNPSSPFQNGEKLRIRRYISSVDNNSSWELTYKGKKEQIEVDGTIFQKKEEFTTIVQSGEQAQKIIRELGYVKTKDIVRWVNIYEDDANDDTKIIVRMEKYPEMYNLIEIEGTPTDIMYMIKHLKLDIDSFSDKSLSDFSKEYRLNEGIEPITHITSEIINWLFLPRPMRKFLGSISL